MNKTKRDIPILALGDKLKTGHRFFLKPRYGSMGKGITYLSLSDWKTNFSFKNNRIIGRISDYGWKFRDITRNHKFLRQLLAKDVFIQETVDSPIIHDNKLDFRVYTFLNKAIYAYPGRNSLDKVTTNISQGGCGDSKLLELLPKKKTFNLALCLAKELRQAKREGKLYFKKGWQIT